MILCYICGETLETELLFARNFFCEHYIHAHDRVHGGGHELVRVLAHAHSVFVSKSMLIPAHGRAHTFARAHRRDSVQVYTMLIRLFPFPLPMAMSMPMVLAAAWAHARPVVIFITLLYTVFMADLRRK